MNKTFTWSCINHERGRQREKETLLPNNANYHVLPWLKSKSIINDSVELSPFYLFIYFGDKCKIQEKEKNN